MNETSQVSGEVMAKAFIAGLAIDAIFMATIAAYKGETIIPPSQNHPSEEKEMPASNKTTLV